MRWTRPAATLWIAALLLLYAVHFLHLRADFPNFSPWMDYAKYTDEGWYGNAAIRHYLFGRWFLRGDFNPAVALPIWPLIEAVVFYFTGVSLAAARALELGILALDLLALYALIRRFAPAWAGLLAVTLALSSAYLYCFTRLAILEPLMLLWILSAWLLLVRLPKAGCGRALALIVTGLLLTLAILTKTTAIFLLPATAWLLYQTQRRRSPAAAVVVACSAVLPWIAYYLLLVRPHHLADYRYLFDANRWVQPATLSGWLGSFWWALHGILWIDPWLVGLTLLLLVASPASWRNPLVQASLLAIAGYILFIGWHNNPQPRYYEVAALPLLLILGLAAANLYSFHRLPAQLAAAALLVLAAVNTARVYRYVRHPEYTWINAARRLTGYIDRHPDASRMLLSISGDEISLITGLPAICDDFGTFDLPSRIHTYRPGWYAAWNEIDPGTLEDLKTQYRLEHVARFHAFDDPDRDVLVLYRMHPLPSARTHYNEADETRENQGK